MYSPERVWPHLVGEGRNGGILVLAVIGLLLLLSGGFVSRIVDVGYSPSWIGVAFAIAIVAGATKAGLVPTIGSLWLFALWWFIFPPLVGYLTGDWETSSRYTYPRMLGYGYESAYHELRGGIERGGSAGLLFAIFVGTVGYGAGTASSRYQSPSDR